MNQHMIHEYDVRLYNALLEEFVCGSGFANYGYWDEKTLNPKQASINLMEKLLGFIPEINGLFLDVACGKGATTQYLSNYLPASHITGINISEKQLQTARQLAAGSNFLIMDASNLGFDDSSFDNILCVEAAFHFNTRNQFLKESFRVLKPGGYLILTDILFQKGAEKRLPSLHEENYIADIENYALCCSNIGFTEVKIMDSTKQSWEGLFWSAIDFAHNKFLRREINEDTLKWSLQRHYKIAEVLRNYLLVCLQKT